MSEDVRVKISAEDSEAKRAMREVGDEMRDVANTAKQANQQIGQSTDAARQAFIEQRRSVRDLTTVYRLQNFETQQVIRAFNAVANVARTLLNIYNSFNIQMIRQNQLTDALARAQENLAEVHQRAADAIASAEERLAEVQKSARERAQSKIQSVEEEINRLREEQLGITDRLTSGDLALRSARLSLTEIEKELSDEIGGVNQRLGENERRLRSIANASERVRIAQELHTNVLAVFGRDSIEARAATLDLERAQGDLNEAMQEGEAPVEDAASRQLKLQRMELDRERVIFLVSQAEKELAELRQRQLNLPDLMAQKEQELAKSRIESVQEAEMAIKKAEDEVAKARIQGLRDEEEALRRVKDAQDALNESKRQFIILIGTSAITAAGSFINALDQIRQRLSLLSGFRNLFPGGFTPGAIPQAPGVGGVAGAGLGGAPVAGAAAATGGGALGGLLAAAGLVGGTFIGTRALAGATGFTEPQRRIQETGKKTTEELEAMLERLKNPLRGPFEAFGRFITGTTGPTDRGIVEAILEERRRTQPLRPVGGPDTATGFGLSAADFGFQQGGDFIASRPTPILVGEAGRERVRVEPLHRMGPTRISIVNTINFTGPISADTNLLRVASTIADEIGRQTALKMKFKRGTDSGF